MNMGDIMKHIEYIPSNVCSNKIEFDITDDGKIKNIRYFGGCDGNLKAISKLCEGQDASKIAQILKGNICGRKATSCADQLSLAISKALSE